MKPAPREHLTVGADELTFCTTSSDSGGALLAFEVRMPPGGGPAMLHRHDSAELYRVEQGEFSFYVAGADGEVTRSTAGAGEVVAIESGREHTIRNESDEVSVAFVVLAPGRELERFVRAAATGGEIATLAAAHGIEMTRPLEVAR